MSATNLLAFPPFPNSNDNVLENISFPVSQIDKASAIPTPRATFQKLLSFVPSFPFRRLFIPFRNRTPPQITAASLSTPFCFSV
jgi:hypothetical protein